MAKGMNWDRSKREEQADRHRDDQALVDEALSAYSRGRAVTADLGARLAETERGRRFIDKLEAVKAGELYAGELLADASDEAVVVLADEEGDLQREAMRASVHTDESQPPTTAATEALHRALSRKDEEIRDAERTVTRAEAVLRALHDEREELEAGIRALEDIPDLRTRRTT